MLEILAVFGMEGHNGFYYIFGFIFWTLIPLLLYRSMREGRFSFLDYVFVILIFFTGWMGLLIAWLVNWFARR